MCQNLRLKNFREHPREVTRYMLAAMTVAIVIVASYLSGNENLFFNEKGACAGITPIPHLKKTNTLQWSLRFKTAYSASKVWSEIEGSLKIEGCLY